MNKQLIKARKKQMQLGWDRILQIGDIRSTFDQICTGDKAVIEEHAGLKRCPAPYLRYYTDSEGHVCGASGRKLSTFTNNGGYKVMLIDKDDGQRTTVPVSRLEAITWLPNPSGLSDVDHIDSNVTNNALANLQWLSHADNLRRREVKGGSRGVTAIELETGKQTKYSSISAAAVGTGISYSTIRGLAKGTYSLNSAGGYYFVFTKEK